MELYQPKSAVPPFHLVTPVWGTQFTDTFLEVTLPCLLSPGNIPGLPDLTQCTYKIFSTDTDFPRIRESPAFKNLCTLMKVELRKIESFDENPYVRSSTCYRTASREAAAAGAVAVYLIPDMVFADGGLRSIARLMQQGKRAVMVAGLRTTKETIVPEVLSRFRAGDAIMAPPQALVELAMRHLHPIMQHHMYDSDCETFNPSFFCWPVAGEGCVVHCAHLHPVAVNFLGSRATFHGTIDDDLLFDLKLRDEELAFVTDSDDLLWFEISARDRSVPPATGKRLWEILKWLNGATYPHQRGYLTHALRVHSNGAESPAWRAAEVHAAGVIATVLSAFELEKDRIGRSPAAYAVPAAVQIGDTEAARDPGSAIRKIMDVAGTAEVLDEVSAALEERARTYVTPGAGRRFNRSLTKFVAAYLIIGAGKGLRTLLRRFKRR